MMNILNANNVRSVLSQSYLKKFHVNRGVGVDVFLDNVTRLRMLLPDVALPTDLYTSDTSYSVSNDRFKQKTAKHSTKQGTWSDLSLPSRFSIRRTAVIMQLSLLVSLLLFFFVVPLGVTWFLVTPLLILGVLYLTLRPMVILKHFHQNIITEVDKYHQKLVYDYESYLHFNGTHQDHDTYSSLPTALLEELLHDK